ncbi:MAG TPA: hypothetical protein VMA34_19375 [Terracidiphilus sp.]|nr:hypothetical protein [Terracidiphilus sp.]
MRAHHRASDNRASDEDPSVGTEAAGVKFTLPQLPETRLQSGPKSIYSNPPPPAMATACRHPRVRIVSRHEDTEFVECLECGEVFDSEEFRDMEIEDTAETENADDSA